MWQLLHDNLSVQTGIFTTFNEAAKARGHSPHGNTVNSTAVTALVTSTSGTFGEESRPLQTPYAHNAPTLNSQNKIIHKSNPGRAPLGETFEDGCTRGRIKKPLGLSEGLSKKLYVLFEKYPIMRLHHRRLSC